MDGSGTVEHQPHPSSLPWAAIPKFTPGVTNVQEYTQKLRFLATLWPTESLDLLAPRVALLIEGTAFHKVAELDPSKLKVKDDSGIALIVKTIGGSWGQTELEQRYEFFERALYGTTQKPDESNDSFLSRMEHNFGELLKRKTSLEEVQAYVLLRQCNLHSEDRKRILLDHAGKLDYEEVKKSFRLVGSKFFAEVQGGKTQKTKVYDVNFTEELEVSEGNDLVTETMVAEEAISEEAMVDQMCAEGDEDAILVTEYEQAAGELIQEDQDMATAFSMYQEARRRLAEKVKNRGFFPTSGKGKNKGKGKGPSGKSFGKGKGSGSLQSRILNSHCRLCGAKGHWKAECPMRNVGGRTTTSAASTTSTAPTSYVTTTGSQIEAENHGLSLEFMNLAELPTLDDAGLDMAELFMCVGENKNHGLAFVRSLVNRTTMRAVPSSKHIRNEPKLNATARIQSNACRLSQSLTPETRQRLSHQAPVVSETTEQSAQRETAEMALFASQGTRGVVDLGATKTVIGSQLVPELLAGLDVETRKKVGRCRCNVTFRFGNQSTLSSTHALVLPVGKLMLKVAVVPGATPFLLSNTLLRAIQAVVDTGKRQLTSEVLGRSIPLQLSPSGLFLLDVNDLCRQPQTAAQCGVSPKPRQILETFSAIEAKADPGELSKVSALERSCIERDDAWEIPVQSQVKLKASPSQHVAWPPKPLAAAAAFARKHAQDQQRRGHRAAALDRPGGHADQLREKAQGKELLTSVGGHRVRELVHGHAREEPEDRAPVVPSLRGTEDPRAGEPSKLDHGRRDDGDGAALAATSQVKGDAQDHGTGDGDPGARERRDDEPAGGGVRASESSHGHGERIAGTIGMHDDTNRETFNDSWNYASCRAPSTTGDPGTSAPPDTHTGPPERETPRETSGGDGDGRWTVVDEWSLLLSAGEPDPSVECIDHADSLTKSKERQKLLSLVRQIQRELDEAQMTFRRSGMRLDLLEVFADEGSQLTRQCQAVGLHADRLGRSHGDLETSEGRQEVWKRLINGEPRHIWFSPVCSPWSAWSRFNGARSMQHAKALISERIARLPQVALGIVLARHQRERNRHFHWEQPSGSSMFLLGGMQEPLAYLQRALFDMCIVGDLRDPETSKPMKKSMQVWTSSEGVLRCLQNRHCRGNHPEHQPLEGQTMFQGQRMSRTMYSQKYPRKFARQIAQLLRRTWERPLLTSEALAVGYGKRPVTAEGSAPKRARMRRVAETSPSVRALADWQSLKRRRIESKQPSAVHWQAWQEAFQDIDRIAPRVGKMELIDHPCSQIWRKQFPQVDLRALVACRGTDRMTMIPEHLKHEPQLQRRLIYIDRQDGTLKGEDSWEPVAGRPRHQLIRKGPSCRLGVTAFGILQESSREHVGASEPENTRQVLTPIGEEDEASREMTEPAVQSERQIPGISKEEQSVLMRVHKNLGHPEPAKLAALLKSQGFRPDIVKSAYRLQCSTCEASREPKKARPSALKEALDFNDRVSVDGFTWSNRHGTPFQVYHFIDHATNFHIGCPSRDQSSEGFIERFCERWLSWAGAPGEMVTDSGTEFNSEKFATFCQEHDLRCRVTSHEAAWQNAKCERHGGILKHMLDKFDYEHPIETVQQLEIALSLCLQAKNATGLKGGYTPEMLVLGKQTRVAASIASDDNPTSHLLAADPRAEGIRFREHLAMRETARKAFHSADNDQALRRAMLRRSCPHRGIYRPGAGHGHVAGTHESYSSGRR